MHGPITTKESRLYDIGKYDEALAAFDKAYEIDPSDIWTCYYRSFILAKQERHEDAIMSADLFLEHETGHGDIWAVKGISLYKIGKYEDAVNALSRQLS